MKFFTLLVIAASFFSQVASAEGVEVPGLGSVWESTSIYKRAVEDGSPPRRESETFKVDRMLAGRPVFAGKMLGFDGEIIESAQGMIVYALRCKDDVPRAMLSPPTSPNQCVGHVCSAPPVGETLTRKTFIYVEMYGCQAQEGEYRFMSVRVEGEGESLVTVGQAEFFFNGTSRGKWESYIKKGIGQVRAVFLYKETTYDKVDVHLVPYKPDGDSTAAALAPIQ